MRLDWPKLEAFLLKPGTRGCPCCCGHEWAPADEQAVLVGCGEGASLDPEHTMPVFPVMCQSCGYVVLFEGSLYASSEASQV